MRWGLLLGLLVAFGCGPPVRPSRVVADLDRFPEVPEPPRLEESDRNVQEGYRQRRESLDEAVERARETGSEKTVHATMGHRLREVAEAYGELGTFALAYRFHDTSDVAFGNALTLEPKGARWWFLRGVSRAQAGRQDESLQDLERAVALDPLNDEAVLQWAEQRLESGSSDGVEERLVDLLELQPDHAYALLRLGRLQQSDGRSEEAIETLRRAHAAAPRASDVRYALAQLLRDDGATEEAASLLEGVAVGAGAPQVSFPRPWLQRVQSLQQGVRPLQRAGEAAYRAGRLEEALRLFSEASALAPDNALPQLNRLLMLVELGRLEAADGQRERLERLAPGHRQLLYLTARMEGLRGDGEAFMRGLRAAIEADPSYAAPRLELARAAFRSGDPQEGREQFRAVLENEPGQDGVRLHWMIAETLHGDPERACDLVPAQGEAMSARVAIGAARVLATVPGSCGASADYGLRVARELYRQDQSADNAQTLAMAVFSSGRRERAVEMQTRIVEQLQQRLAAGAAPRPAVRRTLEGAESRLRGYRSGRTASPVWDENELRELGFLGRRDVPDRSTTADAADSGNNSIEGGDDVD